MEILQHAVSFLFIFDAIRCHSLTGNVFHTPQTPALRDFLDAFENENVAILHQFHALKDQHRQYVTQHYKQTALSSSYKLPDMVRWTGEKTKLYFNDVQILQQPLRYSSTITNFVIRSFEQYYRIGINLKDWPVKVIGSVTIDKPGTKETTNFSIPLNFNAAVHYFCESSGSNITLKKDRELFGTPKPESPEIESSIYENDQTLVRHLRELEFIVSNYILIEIDRLLKTEIHENQIYSLLPPIHKLDAKSSNREYIVFDNRDNFDLLIILQGLSNFNNVTLAIYTERISPIDEEIEFTTDVGYKTTITTERIVGTGYWSYESYELQQLAKGEFSLFADYVQITTRNRLNSGMESYEMRIAPVTVDVHGKEFPAHGYERDFVNDFLSNQIEDIIAASLRSSLEKSMNGLSIADIGQLIAPGLLTDV